MGFLSRAIQNTLLFLIAVCAGELVFHFTGNAVFRFPLYGVGAVATAIFFFSGMSEDEH